MFYVNLILFIFILLMFLIICCFSKNFNSEDCVMFILIWVLGIGVIFYVFYDNLISLLSSWIFTLIFISIIFLLFLSCIGYLLFDLVEIKKCINYDEYLKKKELENIKKELEFKKEEMKELENELNGDNN